MLTFTNHGKCKEKRLPRKQADLKQINLCACVCLCVHVSVCACVRMCMHSCMRGCVFVCVSNAFRSDYCASNTIHTLVCGFACISVCLSSKAYSENHSIDHSR